MANHIKDNRKGRQPGYTMPASQKEELSRKLKADRARKKALREKHGIVGTQIDIQIREDHKRRRTERFKAEVSSC